MKATPGEDAVMIIEMTKKDLECYINLVDKAVAGFEKTDSNFERSTVDKMLPNSTACYRDFIHESTEVANFFTVFFKKLPQPPQPSTTTTLICQQSKMS